MAKDQRQAWEYAQGPEVGKDVPITSEPREEDAPGVPSESAVAAFKEARRERDRREGRGTRPGGTEEREVRAADPELSPETNARLTEELREVIGTDRVEVPRDRPRASQGEQPHKQSLTEYFNQNRFQLVRALAITLTFGAIVALITNDWWVLALAAGVHALGTMTVVMSILRLTTVSEHPSPEVVAAMEEEGVSSPDERFSKMVDEFRPQPDAGTGDVISPGANERTMEASADPAAAGAEQSGAMTPTAQPSHPAGEGRAPDYVIWATALALLIVSIVVPPIYGGGWMWLLTAIMVPLIAAWVVMQRVMIVRGDQVRIDSRRPLVLVAVCTAIAVAGFCALVALAFQH